MANTLVILDDIKLLRKLAELIYYREQDAVNNLPCGDDMDEYLHGCTNNYKSVLDLLDSGDELKRKFVRDPVKSGIANDIFSYIVYCANIALQTVRNYSVRIEYLKKLEEHVKQLTKALNELDPAKKADVQDLADEARQYKEAMLEFLHKYRSPETNSYSQNLKEEGRSFDELVHGKMETIGLYGSFKYIKDKDKIRTYSLVLEESKLKKLAELFKKLKGPAGIAVTLITAGLMVWEIYSASHVFKTATRDVVVSLASAGGACLGDVIGTAIATGLVGVEATSTFVAMAILATSIAGAIAVGMFAGWLVGMIIDSGGSEPIDTRSHHCYVTMDLPDGAVLARQIKHA